MAHKKYVAELSSGDRKELEAFLMKKRLAPKKHMQARVLLKVDEGEKGPACSHARADEPFDVHVNAVTAVARKLVKEGFEAANMRKKHRRSGRTAVIAGKLEETLPALAPGKPPEGHAHWTLRLLADRLVQLRLVESLAHETVRKALEERGCSAYGEEIGNPAGSRRRVRLPDGGHLRSVRGALLCGEAADLHGRAFDVADPELHGFVNPRRRLALLIRGFHLSEADRA